MRGSKNPPHVAVLLCTYHGEQYLRVQLDSLLAQDYPNFSIWISDDSSDINTRDIAEEYRAKWPDMVKDIRSGPRKGSSANFLSLLTAEDIQADYFALSDQDDVWRSDKLSRAVTALESESQNQPALYCSRVALINEWGEPIGLSPLFNKPPSFANALVQSLAGGNTMLLNRCGRELVRRARAMNVVVHDWWIYLLITGAGGTVIYDPKVSLSYRQHRLNEIGCDQSFVARMKRCVQMLSGTHKSWSDSNVRSLKACEHLLTADNRHLLNKYEDFRTRKFLQRLRCIFGFPFYRQTDGGTWSLYLALLLKRL